jgi:hypothetical protein
MAHGVIWFCSFVLGYYYRIRTAMMANGHFIRKLACIGLSLILIGMIGLVNYPNAYLAVIFSLHIRCLSVGMLEPEGANKAREVFISGGIINDWRKRLISATATHLCV